MYILESIGLNLISHYACHFGYFLIPLHTPAFIEAPAVFLRSEFECALSSA